ncbi:MAG TPA: response regulator [Ktedonobacterales bacterium]
MPPSHLTTHEQLILVADDDKVTRDTVRDILEDAGYRSILEAPDGEHALDILRTSSQRLVVILDWLMPHGSGTDVLVARAKEVPLVGRHAYIVLTADARVSQADIDALGLPSDMWVRLLRKPFSLDDMLQAAEDATRALLPLENTAPTPAPAPASERASE